MEVEVQIYPQCRSQKVQRLESLEGGMTGAIGILPPKFQCQDCGWIGMLVMKEILELQKKDVEIDLRMQHVHMAISVYARISMYEQARAQI